MKRAAVLLLSMLGSNLAYADGILVSVPTLDEGGLIALVALVGVLGSIVARRRKKQ